MHRSYKINFEKDKRYKILKMKKRKIHHNRTFKNKSDENR